MGWTRKTVELAASAHDINGDLVFEPINCLSIAFLGRETCGIDNWALNNVTILDTSQDVTEWFTIGVTKVIGNTVSAKLCFKFDVYNGPAGKDRPSYNAMEQAWRSGSQLIVNVLFPTGITSGFNLYPRLGIIP